MDLRGFGTDPNECKSLDSCGKQGRRRSLAPEKTVRPSSPHDAEDCSAVGTSPGGITPKVWIEPSPLGRPHFGNSFTAAVRCKAESPPSPVLDASTRVSVKAGQSCLSSSKGRRREEIREKPKKKLKTLGPKETIVFQDESGFTLHPRLGHGWALLGKRLKIPTTSQHQKRLNVSGWGAPLLGRAGVLQTERGNREGFLKVLQHLYSQLRGYTIWLYVDRARWHRGDPIWEFLRKHRRLRLVYLPPYQPALNMQERIWRQIRYESTTNRWFDNQSGPRFRERLIRGQNTKSDDFVTLLSAFVLVRKSYCAQSMSLRFNWSFAD